MHRTFHQKEVIMKFCTICGAPGAEFQFEGLHRCEGHATTPVPREFKFKSVEGLYRELDREEKFVARMGELEPDVELSGFSVGGKCYKLGNPRILLEGLGLPASYLLSLGEAPSLQRRLIEFERARKRDVPLEIRARDGEILHMKRAVNKNIIPTRMAVDITLEEFTRRGLFHDRVVEEFKIGEHSMFWFTSNVREGMSRNKGDVLAAGVALKVNGTVEAFPYLRRLVCSNGMVRKEHRSARGADLREQVSRALEYSHKCFLKSILKSDQVLVENPGEALRGVIRDTRIGTAPRQELRRRLRRVAGRVVTAFDLVNLVTGVHHMNPGAASRLSLHGGDIAARYGSESRCPSCGKWGTGAL